MRCTIIVGTEFIRTSTSHEITATEYELELGHHAIAKMLEEYAKLYEASWKVLT